MSKWNWFDKRFHFAGFDFELYSPNQLYGEYRFGFLVDVQCTRSTVSDDMRWRGKFFYAGVSLFVLSLSVSRLFSKRRYE